LLDADFFSHSRPDPPDSGKLKSSQQLTPVETWHMSTHDKAAEAGDRTGREYWDGWWERRPLPRPFDPFGKGLQNYPYRRFHLFYSDLFTDARGQRLIEIGCAQSVYLPYFVRYFGLNVAGIDQSELGCKRARQILDRERVHGEIYCGDFFAPPPETEGVFDWAVSYGVLEHFDDTAGAVRAVARFLKSCGRIITIVPNLTGILGRYQRLLDRKLFEAHVPLSAERLAEAHRDAGLEVESALYVLPFGLEVTGIETWGHGVAGLAVKIVNTVATRSVRLLDDHVVRLTPNRWTSPYVVCIASKPPGKGQVAQ
jgi:SAM-dependent methyltransferase